MSIHTAGLSNRQLTHTN